MPREEVKDPLEKIKNQKTPYCFGFFHQSVLDEESNLTKIALTCSATGHAYFTGRGYNKISSDRFKEEARKNPEIDCCYFRQEIPFLNSFLHEVFPKEQN